MLFNVRKKNVAVLVANTFPTILNNLFCFIEISKAASYNLF